MALTYLNKKKLRHIPLTLDHTPFSESINTKLFLPPSVKYKTSSFSSANRLVHHSFFTLLWLRVTAAAI